MKQHYRLIAAVSTLALLAACGNSTTMPDTAAEADIAADVQAKEAEVAQQQAELERLQAELAAQQAANETRTPPPVASTPAPRPSTPKPKPAKPPSQASTPAPAPAMASVTVPSGTTLPLSLSTALTSKTAKVGDVVRARVTSDVQVDGRTAIASGTTVAGSVIKVVSGSDRIGGTPTLVVAFDRLELAGGRDVQISGEVTSQGKSDTTRDTVKIVGGAAAGALLGDQVSKKDRGKVIGGLLGAAAGAAAAKHTGTEVQLAEGTDLQLTLASAVEISR